MDLVKDINKNLNDVFLKLLDSQTVEMWKKFKAICVTIENRSTIITGTLVLLRKMGCSHALKKIYFFFSNCENKIDYAVFELWKGRLLQ